ncbi:TPA: hypothetical protein ACNEGY_002429 [Escherichia coli]|nr:hypothetical protein [Escherichia coli]
MKKTTVNQAISRYNSLLRNPQRQLTVGELTAQRAYFHERRSLNNFHRDRVITFEQIAE